MNTETVVSLFSGGMGLDLGFEKQDFDIRVAVDNDPAAHKTMIANGCQFPVIGNDIMMVESDCILKTANLAEGECTVLTGAPPCEPFSTAGNRKGLRDVRAGTIGKFIQIIRECQPEYFAFEEVPGFVRAAKRHIPYYERASMSKKDIPEDARLGSAFEEVMVEFERLGYQLSLEHDNPKNSILNAADFGAPQKRMRFVMIGARSNYPVDLPEPTHGVPDSTGVISGKLQPWNTLRDALAGINYEGDSHFEFPHKWGQFLHLVPEGGCWRDLPKHLHRRVLGGAYDDGKDPLTAGNKGGRTGFMRRLAWDRPAPTLVDSPINKSGCLCHPEETRPLSVKEYARIQGFPDEWVFAGTMTQRYRLIGQATPVALGQAIAKSILKHRQEVNRQ